MGHLMTRVPWLRWERNTSACILQVVICPIGPWSRVQARRRPTTGPPSGPLLQQELGKDPPSTFRYLMEGVLLFSH